MTAIGMETFLSRPANRSPLDAERAATANTVGADLMISLRCETQPSPSANGVASFYFGSSHGSVSTIGRNLADFIQREVVARTGLRDCRTMAGPGICCGSPGCRRFRSTSATSPTRGTGRCW